MKAPKEIFELAIATDHYAPLTQKSAYSYMCISLTPMHMEGLITHTELARATESINTFMDQIEPDSTSASSLRSLISLRFGLRISDECLLSIYQDWPKRHSTLYKYLKSQNPNITYFKNLLERDIFYYTNPSFENDPWTKIDSTSAINQITKEIKLLTPNTLITLHH